jgi:predicted O-linked N-acetylglucosamine transferase (SPINDLY family)
VKGTDLTTRIDHSGWRAVLSTPERVGPYIDLFCELSKTKRPGEASADFVRSAAAWMLMLDEWAITVIVNRNTELRKGLEIDVAEHLSPLLDAVLAEQLRRGMDPIETPVQFLLRRDDPRLALILAERFLERTRRRIAAAAWREDSRPQWTWTPERRMRIGYVCSDLNTHPVGLSIRTLLLGHDKSRFEIFLYDRTSNPEKAVAGPVAMGADIVRPCLGVTSEALETLVRGDGIDILVDLSGAVIGSADTVFSRPAAPARVSMIGYPGSMGRETIDYMVVDRSAVPESERAGVGERLIVMPGSFLPLDDTFEIGTDLPTREGVGLPRDAFVMAAFNRLDKVNVETVRMWVACLKAIPSSVLWLAVDDEGARASLVKSMEGAGISRDRVLISGRVSILAHARRHTLADVSLDTLGYNGGYTTALSLMCGVPVVNRPGRCFAWRMSAGLLRQAGLGDCVVDTSAAYLAQVRRIAEDSDHASSLRNKLAPENFSRAFETRRYVGALERAFVEIAEQGRRGEAPSDIELER